MAALFGGLKMVLEVKGEDCGARGSNEEAEWTSMSGVEGVEKLIQ